MIIGDSDEPGRKGAEALASELVLHCPSVRLVYPPNGIKDLRQWKAAGLTREQLEQIIQSTVAVRIRVSTTIKSKEVQVRHG